MITYKKRNLDNLAKLADHTKVAALKWHEFCEKNNIDVLIYETIRTKEQQARNVAKKVSQTMRSYHIVGQALDFVKVSGGESKWNGYFDKDIQKAVKEAKRLGFTWGADWNNNGLTSDETFIDSPHLQFTYKGYGSDTFGKWKPEEPKKSTIPNPNVIFKEGSKAKYVGYIQKEVGVKVDNIFGPKTTAAVKAWQKKHGLAADGMVGPKTWKVMFGE